ncbi:hypothetical protein J2Z57_002598 [Formosa algae]|uniref:Uncharacterized protein n=1 Tax=Formosa algae TaxID=225843 RepID=A0A9X0YN32_9FLAO|nr:hypothetical protein [Formosa algae]MDQ0336145.1 hypothetical protein [Formosa algae]
MASKLEILDEYVTGKGKYGVFLILISGFYYMF